MVDARRCAAALLRPEERGGAGRCTLSGFSDSITLQIWVLTLSADRAVPSLGLLPPLATSRSSSTGNRWGGCISGCADIPRRGILNNRRCPCGIVSPSNFASGTELHHSDRAVAAND